MLKELILKNRSYRRFDSQTVSIATLRDLVDHARITGCAKNMQTIRYALVSNPEVSRDVFSCLAWAGFLKDWPGPVPKERPGGYIIMLQDTATPNRWIDLDMGIAAQSILLAAVEQGLGGCMIAAVRREDLRSVINLDVRYEIKLVLALGTPVEKVVLNDVELGGDTRYWREADGTHHVPKLALDALIIGENG